MRDTVVALVLVAMLAGCDGNGPEPPEPSRDAQVSETIQDVDYYYACGNEVLELPDGRRFYPLVDQDVLDEDASANAVTSEASLVPVTLAVPAPRPGDDRGTLTIYADGTARFVSETGTEARLTEEEQTYTWVC